MQKEKYLWSWKTQMAGLQKSNSPKPELSHSTTDRWLAGSHQHWHTGLSLLLALSLFLSPHPSHQELNHIRPLSQIYGVYFRFCNHAPIPSIVFDCVYLYNNRVCNFAAQYGARPQTFAIHQTNKLSSDSFLLL